MCSVCSCSGCEWRQIVATDVSTCVSVSWLDIKDKAQVSTWLPSLYKYVKFIYVDGDVATGGYGSTESCVQSELVLGLSAKQMRNSDSPFALSVCTRTTLKKADCHEISYLSFLLNSVPTLSSSLKPDKRAKYVYDLSSSSVVVIDTICILFEVSVNAEETVSRRSSQAKNEV